MRQGTRRWGDQSAAAPATVTGKVARSTGIKKIGWEGGRPLGETPVSASRETCQHTGLNGGRGVPRRVYGGLLARRLLHSSGRNGNGTASYLHDLQGGPSGGGGRALHGCPALRRHRRLARARGGRSGSGRLPVRLQHRRLGRAVRAGPLVLCLWPHDRRQRRRYSGWGPRPMPAPPMVWCRGANAP